MKKGDKIELLEEYNEKGICVKRTINGFELPADKEPSVVFFGDVKTLTQKSYLTKEEAKERYRLTSLNNKL